MHLQSRCIQIEMDILYKKKRKCRLLSSITIFLNSINFVKRSKQNGWSSISSLDFPQVKTSAVSKAFPGPAVVIYVGRTIVLHYTVWDHNHMLGASLQGNTAWDHNERNCFLRTSNLGVNATPGQSLICILSLVDKFIRIVINSRHNFAFKHKCWHQMLDGRV